ncbi:MAG: hypothetical protein KKH60_11025, partial [Proteobacteria bacterium]|nr:hypothetical protein [Pseudomonadota bacterium]
RVTRIAEVEMQQTPKIRSRYHFIKCIRADLIRHTVPFATYCILNVRTISCAHQKPSGLAQAIHE